MPLLEDLSDLGLRMLDCGNKVSMTKIGLNVTIGTIFNRLEYNNENITTCPRLSLGLIFLYSFKLKNIFKLPQNPQS
jgi:hypothetical protein